MKKNNKKGFTLAELLIVVAIIAVLTAVAIPVFTNQLEKSREATDLSNARSAYAELMVKILDGKDGNFTSGQIPNCAYVIDCDGDSTATITGLNQKIDGWTMDMSDVMVGGVVPSGLPTGTTGTCVITTTVDANGDATTTVEFT